jgi:hypothetical protein
MDFRDYLNLIEDISSNHEPKVHDNISIEMGDVVLETYIEEILEDGIVVKVDEAALELMIESRKLLSEKMKMGASTDASAGGTFVMGEGMSDVGIVMQEIVDGIRDVLDVLQHPENAEEEYARDIIRNKMKKVATDNNLDTTKDFAQVLKLTIDELKNTGLIEAEYQGRKVPLNKPMQGDVAKSKVYVKGPKGNVVKVNFGDKNMRIKKSNPNRRRSFRARHNCENPGPKWKARYWSCRAW